MIEIVWYPLSYFMVIFYIYLQRAFVFSINYPQTNESVSALLHRSRLSKSEVSPQTLQRTPYSDAISHASSTAC